MKLHISGGIRYVKVDRGGKVLKMMQYNSCEKSLCIAYV